LQFLKFTIRLTRFAEGLIVASGEKDPGSTSLRSLQWPRSPVFQQPLTVLFGSRGSDRLLHRSISSSAGRVRPIEREAHTIQCVLQGIGGLCRESLDYECDAYRFSHLYRLRLELDGGAIAGAIRGRSGCLFGGWLRATLRHTHRCT